MTEIQQLISSLEVKIKKEVEELTQQEKNMEALRHSITNDLVAIESFVGSVKNNITKLNVSTEKS